MPTLNSLRQRVEEKTALPLSGDSTCEMFVSDPRARLTPKQLVETKFHHALARMERDQVARKLERE